MSLDAARTEAEFQCVRVEPNEMRLIAMMLTDAISQSAGVPTVEKRRERINEIWK